MFVKNGEEGYTQYTLHLLYVKAMVILQKHLMLLHLFVLQEFKTSYNIYDIATPRTVSVQLVGQIIYN